MKLGRKNILREATTEELRVVVETGTTTIKSTVAAPPAHREAALREAQAAAKSVAVARAELKRRGAVTRAAGAAAREAQLEAGAEPRTEWERMQAVAREREAARKRDVAAGRAKEAERAHEQKVRAGRALTPLWSLEPHLAAIAVLGSGLIWSWSRGIATPGLSISSEDEHGNVTTTTPEELARRGGRIEPLLDAEDVVMLWAAVHVIAERGGTAGHVQINPSEERLWPQGMKNRRGALRRLATLELLTLEEHGASRWTLGYGPRAQEETARFVRSFKPPEQPKRKLPFRRETRPDPVPASDVDIDELIAQLEERVQAGEDWRGPATDDAEEARS